MFTPIVGCGGNCTQSSDCDDKNACTTDTCTLGKCANAANTLACDDGNACTLGDTCANGTCAAGFDCVNNGADCKAQCTPKTTCATKACGFEDDNCGGQGTNCYCDADCAKYGDCCNADGSGPGGKSCAGSTCAENMAASPEMATRPGPWYFTANWHIPSTLCESSVLRWLKDSRDFQTR